MSDEEKLNLIRQGRPMPDLNLEQQCMRKNQARSFIRHFSRDTYDRIEWLCGCNVMNTLHCFPCLLFSDPLREDIWIQKGMKDLTHLAASGRSHESSKSHLTACIDMNLLINRNQKSNVEFGNRKVMPRESQHKFILMLSDLKLSSILEMTLNSNSASEINIMQEFQNMIGKYFLKDIDCTQIFDCILKVCRDTIKKEIASADCVAIQCDTISDVSNHYDVAVTFRYVHDGVLQERFWSFLSLADETPEVMTAQIEEVLEEVIPGAPQKLISQSYDGSYIFSVAPSKIKAKYVNAHFVASYAHDIYWVIQKAVAHHPPLRMFINDLFAIGAFFSNKAHMCDTLRTIVLSQLPSEVMDCTRSWDKIVALVHQHHEEIVAALENITRSCTKSSTIREALSLKRALEEPDFLFWLSLFQRLIPALQKGYVLTPDERILTNIQPEIADIVDDLSIGVVKKRKMDNPKDTCIAAKESCEDIITALKDRLFFTHHVKAELRLNGIAPDEEPIIEAYPFFERRKLRTELDVLYEKDLFGHTSQIVKLYNFIREMKLDGLLPETIKLIKILLTTPGNKTESERCFATLQRIRGFLKNTASYERLTAQAMMAVNREFVQEITNFENLVLEAYLAL